MSQNYFSKLDPQEKTSRLVQLGLSKGQVTVWLKGQKDKTTLTVLDFDKDRSELILNDKTSLYPANTSLLVSFELRGMFFFSEVILMKSIAGYNVLHFKDTLFKSEKRSSYRLLTYPIYEVWSEFDPGEAYQGGNVVNIQSKTSATSLFKNFLTLVDDKKNEGEENFSHLKIRVQDLSATGMSIHIGELESKYFNKDWTFKKVNIVFKDEVIQIPEVKVVYVVDYLSGDKNLKKFKVGLNFTNLPLNIDEKLGKKINSLLREINFNKDFENFIK